MGYSTEFKGELMFKEELTSSQLAELNKYLGKDRRELDLDDSVYTNNDEYWYHIDLKLTEDFSGVKWNGSEKTYDLNHIVNFLTNQMKKVCPNFELVGKLFAQGEDFEDRWELVMIKGVAIKKDLRIVGQKITCPKCEETFILEEEEED